MKIVKRKKKGKAYQRKIDQEKGKRYSGIGSTGYDTEVSTKPLNKERDLEMCQILAFGVGKKGGAQGAETFGNQGSERQNSLQRRCKCIHGRRYHYEEKQHDWGDKETRTQQGPQRR